MSTSEMRIFRGIVANPGEFSGTAVVVKDDDIQAAVEQMARLKGPFVLIAESTHPHYVPIMLRCAAFVTEEGGLLSHAAITAREWGVPCIVGVSGILEYVRTGDFVVGDSDGTVKVYRSD